MAVLLVAVAAHAQSGTNPPGVNPTHYWTYQLLQPFPQPTPLLVHDQFLVNDTPIDVDALLRLVNWVHKNGSPVPDTLIHYTWWNIPAKLPVGAPVIVTNQFGQYPVQVLNLEFMLVPAWKNQPQPIQPNANHYLCYRAQGFPPPTFPLQLTDEWRADVQIAGPMEFLCVPCWKTHNGAVYPPPDPVTHLAVYPIQPTSDVFYPFVMDQLAAGPRFVQQKPLEYLMVPSLKQEISTPTKTETWGRIKMLYR